MSGPVLTPEETDFFKDADPAGYILFGRNCETPAQLRRLTDSLRDLHGREHLMVSIDQEGGRVARLRPPVWADYPPAGVFGALYQIAPASGIEAARANGHAMGLELAEMGISVTYHPPLDVRQPYGHNAIGDRSFGSDPMQVAALGRATLHGLAKAGVAGCIKHMPGQGRSLADSHKSLPTITHTAEELEMDMTPFRALNRTPIGMTGHLRFTAWDEEHPATMSATIIRDIIRGDIGFDGLLLTDDLDMDALSGSVPDRAEAAIAAGCDIALNCWAKMDDMVPIAERLPPLTEKGAARLARALDISGAVTDGPGKHELLARRDEFLLIVNAQA